MDNEVAFKSFDDIEKELNGVDPDNRYVQKSLLSSLNESYNKRDGEAVFDAHRYFDFKMKSIEKPENGLKPTSQS
jgi:hypothetical protein